MCFIDMSSNLRICRLLKLVQKLKKPFGMSLKLLLKAAAKESHQNVSGMLTEAISDYLKRRRIRPVVKSHLLDSIKKNEELGQLLAK